MSFLCRPEVETQHSHILGRPIEDENILFISDYISTHTLSIVNEQYTPSPSICLGPVESLKPPCTMFSTLAESVA
jgi:hypothetical protein